MAFQDVTATPTAIANIDQGKLYIVQNRTGGYIYLDEAQPQPQPTPSRRTCSNHCAPRLFP